MTSLVAKTSNFNGQMPPVQGKASRNKRKFRAEPSLADPDYLEFLDSGLFGGKFSSPMAQEPQNTCSMCGVGQDHSDAAELDIGLSPAPCKTWQCLHGEEPVLEETRDADWNDLTESQLEELLLNNLDAIFQSAIKKVVACGYSQEAVTRAILRSGACYWHKDTVSNIADSVISYLRSGEMTHPSRGGHFEDLQQLEKYVLAELVCFLREVRPFFSTGDAMWSLLICDMNVSHACAMHVDPTAGIFSDDTASESSSGHFQAKSGTGSSRPDIQTACNGLPCISCSCDSRGKEDHDDVNGTKNAAFLTGLTPEKGLVGSTFEPADGSFIHGASFPRIPEENVTITKKAYSGSCRRDHVLRHKPLHLEKNHRACGSKGSFRGGKPGCGSGLILDKRVKPFSAPNCAIMKNRLLTMKPSQDIIPHKNGSKIHSVTPGLPPAGPVKPTASTSAPSFSRPDFASIPAPINPNNGFSLCGIRPGLPTPDTELSLSLPMKGESTSFSAGNPPRFLCCFCAGLHCEKSVVKCVPPEKKDEMIVKLLPRVQELQNQLQEWTEWANQKVMQATRRLSKDRSELKLLRQEKEEVERLKKEKQMLEENTMKKLTEMENALCKASGQVDRANSAVKRLEVENAALRKEMEDAKAQATESAASCQEVSKREKKTMVKFHSWEKQKKLLQEELASDKHKLSQLLEEIKQAKQLLDQQEAKRKQEEKGKSELLMLASSLRKERGDIEFLAKTKEDTMKSKAEANLRKYTDEVHTLEKEIAKLRVKSDSSKIATLRKGIDGSYARRLVDSPTGARWVSTSNCAIDLSVNGEPELRRERECVMCLSDEMSVVFLPCAHQVVCTTCNELHEKQGMRDCPSCRAPIQRRVQVLYSVM